MMPREAQIEDGTAITAAELRFREDMWLTAPIDAVEEAEVKRCHFGPILATVFGDLPESSLMNLVQGAAEPGAVEGGHLAEAIEWLRSHEVDYLVSVALDRPGTRAAEDWLERRGYERGSKVRRFTRPLPAEPDVDPTPVAIRRLAALETEGMSHIVVNALDLPGLSSVLLLGLPDRPGWHCYAASVEGTEVACGSMLVAEKLALLGLDATLPEARRRGCHKALIERRLRDAARAGCEAALAEVCDVLPTSRVAAANLERAGFAEVTGRTNWRRPTGIG
jgi:GNAT superfamily N-acetyltransferase